MPYGMPHGMMGYGWTGFWAFLWSLIGIATLVLLVVLIVRLWPTQPATFQSSEPTDTERGRSRDDRADH